MCQKGENTVKKCSFFSSISRTLHLDIARTSFSAKLINLGHGLKATGVKKLSVIINICILKENEIKLAFLHY